jgi:hypothetical protein
MEGQTREETARRSEGRCGKWETMEGESNQPFDGNTHHPAEFE